MPSLRRAFSSPSVRVSPYPTLPSSRAHRAHRRSSGSDVSDRKVLADIDWWRVADGQREQGGEEEDEGEGEGEERDVVSEDSPASADAVDPEAIPPRNATPELPTTERDESASGAGPERPSTPVASAGPLSEGDDPVFFGHSSQVKERFPPDVYFRTHCSLKNFLFCPLFLILWPSDDTASLVRAAGVFCGWAPHPHAAQRVKVLHVIP